MSQAELKRSEITPNREGFALVTTLLVVLILSVLAVGVAWIAGSEKKTSFAESVHVRSVYAADAGGEAAINFIRLSGLPPSIDDFGTMLVQTQGTTGLSGSQTYDYQVFFSSKMPKPGWGMEYLDYDYRVTSHGTASRLGQSGIQMMISRLYKEGY